MAARCTFRFRPTKSRNSYIGIPKPLIFPIFYASISSVTWYPYRYERIGPIEEQKVEVRVWSHIYAKIPILPRPGIGSKTGLPRPTPAFPTPTNTQREAADGATTPAGPIIPSGPTPLFAGGVKQGGKNLVSDEPYRRIRALRRAEGQLTDQPTKLYDQRKDLIGRRRPTAICGVSEGGGQ